MPDDMDTAHFYSASQCAMFVIRQTNEEGGIHEQD
jgi:hypothetical protein